MTSLERTEDRRSVQCPSQVGRRSAFAHMPASIRKSDTIRTQWAFVTIPRHDPVNAYTMGGIVQDAGLDADSFKKLL